MTGWLSTVFEEDVLFLKKKNQKNFAPLRARVRRARANAEGNQSFFCVPMSGRTCARSESGRAEWFKKEDSF
jgi:hypothetical protein